MRLFYQYLLNTKGNKILWHYVLCTVLTKTVRARHKAAVGYLNCSADFQSGPSLATTYSVLLV